MMKLNPDEFDYNFYTYGFALYENMPLIEPLEYREVKRIREFVIAIDTSGSRRCPPWPAAAGPGGGEGRPAAG